MPHCAPVLLGVLARCARATLRTLCSRSAGRVHARSPGPHGFPCTRLTLQELHLFVLDVGPDMHSYLGDVGRNLFNLTTARVCKRGRASCRPTAACERGRTSTRQLRACGLRWATAAQHSNAPAAGRPS